MRAATRRDVIGMTITDVVQTLPEPASGGVAVPGISFGDWNAREYFLFLNSGDALWLTPDMAFRPLMIGPAAAVKEQTLRRCDYILKEFGADDIQLLDILVSSVDEVILRLSHEKYLWVAFPNEGPELLCDDHRYFQAHFEDRIDRTLS
jgi:hypothetical protein